MISSILTNDHFLLGLGLAFGPGIIVTVALIILYKQGFFRKTPNSGNSNSAIAISIANLQKCVDNIHEDLKDFTVEQQRFREDVLEKYVQWDVFNRIMAELKLDRKERWKEFDYHKHDSTSGVVVKQI